MATPPVDPSPSDAELISAVRAGDNAAYGALFERHRDAARRMASQLVPGPDGDDLVSEAFIKVLGQLQAGAGPDVAFRAYLLTAIRRLHIDRVRAERRVQPSDDLEKYDAGVEFTDPSVAAFENSTAAKAFTSLPERWQLVLWHLDVEGAKPADVAPMLGMTANGVSALAYRAREGLRQAYLQLHLADTGDEKCRWTTEHLGAYVRSGLGKRDSVKVREHLDECPRCTAVYLELAEVNSGLRGLLAPVLLGAVGVGYVAASRAEAAAGATAGANAGAGWISDTFSRTRDWATAAPANGVAAAGVTLGVIGAVVASTMVLVSLGGTTSPSSDEASDPPALTLPGPTAAPEPATPAPPAGSDDPNADPSGAGPAAVPPLTSPVVPGPTANDPDNGGPDNSGPDNDGPGSDDGPGDDPGTDRPGTDNPGTDGPGTDNSQPTQPTEPEPTDPEPTDPEPTEPTEPPVEAPTAPTGLTIADEPDGVTLAWDAVDGADGYEVSRSEAGEGSDPAAATVSVARVSAGSVSAGRVSTDRLAATAASGEVISGPEPLTETSFVDVNAPEGAEVVYEVVAVNEGGASTAAVLGPLRLPSVGVLSIRIPLLGQRCVVVDGSAVRLGGCGSATSWRIWDGGTDSGWLQLRAASGPQQGLCLTAGTSPLAANVSVASCDGSTRQDWELDLDDDGPQQVANRARSGQVLDATLAAVGGRLMTVIGLPSDPFQRFVLGPAQGAASAPQ